MLLSNYVVVSHLIFHCPWLSKRWASSKYAYYLLCFFVNIDVFMWKAKDFHIVELVKVIYYNDVSIIQSFAVVLQGFIYSTGDVCIVLFSEHSFLVVHISIWYFFNCVCSRARFAVLRKQNLNISLHYNVWKIIGSWWCEESEKIGVQQYCWSDCNLAAWCAG
jgi:hypothetical protein